MAETFSAETFLAVHARPRIREAASRGRSGGGGRPPRLLFKLIRHAVTFAGASLRVMSGHHTWPQVIVGIATGCIGGLLWSYACQKTLVESHVNEAIMEFRNSNPFGEILVIAALLPLGFWLLSSGGRRLATPSRATNT